MRDQVSYPYETTGKTEGKSQKCEVAFCLAIRHEGAYVRQWKYTTVRSEPQQQIVVSNKFHDPAALTQLYLTGKIM